MDGREDLAEALARLLAHGLTLAKGALLALPVQDGFMVCEGAAAETQVFPSASEAAWYLVTRLPSGHSG